VPDDSLSILERAIAADWIVDIGAAAGEHGVEVICAL
jgi:excinuclease UvrABC ATPase subunit